MSASVTAPTVEVGAACATRGTALQDPFCHRCGEKRLDHHDYHLGHFLEHVVTATHLISLIMLVELVLVGPASLLIWQVNGLRAQPLGFGDRDLLATGLIGLGIAAWAGLRLRTYGGRGPRAGGGRWLFLATHQRVPPAVWRHLRATLNHPRPPRLSL